MAVIGTDYVPVRPKLYPKSAKSLAVDAKFWKSFKSQKSEQQIAAVTNVQFSPVAPYDFAVTSSTRVTIYDGKTKDVKKVISRFSDVAYSGAYRGDGQLIVAGGETGIIQVFDASTRTLLRQLKGHKRSVRWVRYSPEDKLHVLSASDDNSVRWWDVATETQIFRMDQHTDYVRCGAASSSSDCTWATGSYDHTVRLWDVRAKKDVLQLKLAAPVEDVMFLPSGSALAAASGNVVHILDIIGAGKVLFSLANHQKTVTKVCMAHPTIAGTPAPRLVSASLDGQVRMFEMEKFKLTHAAKYTGGSILSMDFSPPCSSMVVGMSDGALVVRDSVKSSQSLHLQDAGPVGLLGSGKAQSSALVEFQPPIPVPRTLNPSTYRYFLRGRNEKPSESDFFHARERKVTLTKYDKFFRKFYYRDALTASLQNRDPKVTIAVMEELVARRGLARALTDLDEFNLVALISFLANQATSPKFARLLVPVTLRVLDMYSGSFKSIPEMKRLINLLKTRVSQEVQLLIELQTLQGSVELLRHSASLI